MPEGKLYLGSYWGITLKEWRLCSLLLKYTEICKCNYCRIKHINNRVFAGHCCIKHVKVVFKQNSTGLST